MAPPTSEAMSGARSSSVPGLAICWILLAGKRPTLKLIALCLVGTSLPSVFLAFDLSRPEESRTHLGRLFEDVRDQGGQVFFDIVGRKVRTQVRVARGRPSGRSWFRHARRS